MIRVPRNGNATRGEILVISIEELQHELEDCRLIVVYLDNRFRGFLQHRVSDPILERLS